VAELEGQLDEWNSLFDEAIRERDRLHLAEAELTKTVDRLTGEMSTLKTAHQDELNRLLEARTTVEKSLQKERDEVVRKLEATT